MKSWGDSSSNDHMRNGTRHTSDCCMWDGVACNKKTGHVIGLDLSSGCLYGTLPQNSTLFSLDHLRVLDLSDNNFNSSPIPSAIDHLSKLTSLKLSQSSFSGSVPSGISNLSSLSLLDLSSNVGLKIQPGLTFQKFVANLTRLTLLALDQMDISSVVPAILSNFTSLKGLSLVSCNLYGEFPVEILQLPEIEVVALSYNNLEGYLPEFPLNSPFRYIDLKSTSFSGEIPSSIGNLGNLTYLDLSDTNVIGPIPSSLGKLTELTSLLVSCNGNLPSSVTNLTKLTALSLSNLHITPQILESWLLKLNHLDKLALNDMSLYGEIPPALANITGLSWLDLGSNNLTGRLPLWLGNLTNLYFLDLSNNQFQGPMISQWFSQLINLEMLFLSSNGSVGVFDPLLKLPNLHSLDLSGINLKFPPQASTNYSLLPKFGYLKLASCNITEFPQFLHDQDELQALDLRKNSIIGSIPQWFVNLTAENLLSVVLDHNSLTGFETPQAFLPWNNMEALFIQHNMLQGQLPIPPNSLRIYQVPHNQLSGVIPEQICRATSLIYFDAHVNNLSGQIPACIGPKLGSSLQVLNLLGNSLLGTIPQTFTRACLLKMINLSQNQLVGELPKSLTNCTMLEVLDVGNNHLNDTFPSWLGSLLKLQVIVLRHNKFYGKIGDPMFAHSFPSLRIIDLSNNFHTGNLPSTYIQNWLAMSVTSEDESGSSNSDVQVYLSVAGTVWEFDGKYTYEITIINKGSEIVYTKILNVFRVIDFSSNNFTGGIPRLLGNLRGLQALNLSNNHIVGGIPSSLANITDLESLDLSQNMLSGEIPQQLTDLTFLAIFNVSQNRLVGPIPQGQQFNTFDNSSYDGNLALCGAPLLSKCWNTDSLPPLMPDGEIEEDSKFIDWIIRSLGCVGGCIIGFVIGKIYITDRYHDWFMETFGRRRQPKTRPRRSMPRHKGN